MAKFSVALAFPVALALDCTSSDQSLLEKRSKLCRSGINAGCGPETLNVTADGDWPNQAVYLRDVLSALVAAGPCLSSNFSRDTLGWLDGPQSDLDDGSSFMNTWNVFQVQYYDMPRKPGVRIEAPDTLGRKCWAMALLKQNWEQGLDQQLEEALAASGGSLDRWIHLYKSSIGLTMDLCQEVMDNCFVNASYDPSRKGSCSGKIFEFHTLGFQRENLKRAFSVNYPFDDSAGVTFV